MKSQVVKRSINVDGSKTSVSLEDAFWNGLKDIAHGHHLTVSDLVSAIDDSRQHGSLSSALRLFVLDFYRGQLFERDSPEMMASAVNGARLTQSDSGYHPR
jgi:predicted DNA-binding ribbon-helix-helix protein